MKYLTYCAVLLAALSLPLRADEHTWAQWLKNTVERHPLMQAYQYDINAAQYRAAALAKPIYNPSLNTSLEREGSETNFQIGLSSDIDWWDMRASQSELGQLQAKQSMLAMTITTNDLLAQILTAQINVQLGQQAYELARLQVEQDLKLLKLTEEQLAAGESNQTDLAMAKSIVVQGMVGENEQLNEWLSAQKSLRALAGEQAESVVIDNAFWQSQPVSLKPEQLQELPLVKRARLDLLAAKAAVEQQEMANKPVPNVGFGVGRQAGESLVSLNLSVPIQFRNDFSDVVDASREQALASEQRLHAQWRDTKATVDNLAKSLQQTRGRFMQWQQLDDNAMNEQVEVLQQRYAQGDLSLADYQWQLQQLRAGIQAGLALQSNYQLTYVAYLHATATLTQQIYSLIPQEH